MGCFTQWKRTGIFLAACLLTLAAFQGLYHFDNKYNMGKNLVQDGILEISGDILGKDGLIWAADGWELFPDELLEPGTRRAGYPMFVGEHPTWAPFHTDASPYGRASYRLRVLWKGEPATVCLYLPEVFSACRVYADGVLVGQSGTLSPYSPLVRDLTVSFPLEGETEIVVQTANYTHYYSGMTYPPALGSAQAVARLTAGRLALYGAMCFGALAVSLYSLALWLGTQRDRLALLLAGLTLSFAVRMGYPFRLLPGVRWVSLTYALEDVAAMAVIWFSLRLALELAGKTDRPWAAVVRRLAFGMVLTAALVPAAVLPSLPAFSTAYGVLVSLWRLASAVILVGTAVLGGIRSGAMWLVSGTGVYAAGLFLSVTTINQFEPVRGAWPDEWGSFALVLCFSGLMVSRNRVLVRENWRLNQNLQQEVERQTAQIAGLVDERQRLLSEFLHDLKSPLTSVLSYTRVVREHNILLDEQTRSQLNVIEEKSEELAHQLRMMQQFTTQNPMASHRELMELSGFLTEFHRYNQPDVEANGPDLLLELPDRPCPVLADREKLKRALQNLLFNALSFTPEDGAITLTLERREGQAWITVRDTGCGIAPEIRDRLFQRGFTTRAEDGGEGLGLFIVQAVAKEHGGCVEVESQMGKGSAFTIRLPLAPDPQPG